jgi:hypothetical protein
MMKKHLVTLCLMLLFAGSALADVVGINHFTIKNNPFAQNEIAIVATDTANNIRENVNGLFSFSINGFQENLRFEKGTAFYRHHLDKSTFLYVKHEDEKGAQSALYYVYKGDHELSPIQISWIVLISIPIVLILIGYMFRKLIILAIIIFIIFIYFNFHHGLGVGTFFESIIDGLKGMFSKS